MAYELIGVEPIAGALGAVISGVDLKRPLDERAVAEIRAAWLDHLVVFFRDQELTPAEFLAFARRFGTPDDYPFVKGIEGYPAIIQVAKLEHERVNFGGIWHSDTTYLERPPMAAMLLAREVPPVGGDTLFANMTLAYETLSGGMKKLIADLHGIQLAGTRKINHAPSGEVRAQQQRKLNPPMAQPVVRVHPETGKKALYLGEKVKRFDGMTEDESQPLIQYLNAHATKPEFVYRQQWRNNDIVVWDNRCTMHQALGDFDETQRRHMERTTVLGTPSGYAVMGG